MKRNSCRRPTQKSFWRHPTIKESLARARAPLEAVSAALRLSSSGIFLAGSLGYVSRSPVSAEAASRAAAFEPSGPETLPLRLFQRNQDPGGHRVVNSLYTKPLPAAARLKTCAFYVRVAPVWSPDSKTSESFFTFFPTVSLRGLEEGL